MKHFLTLFITALLAMTASGAANVGIGSQPVLAALTNGQYFVLTAGNASNSPVRLVGAGTVSNQWAAGAAVMASNRVVVAAGSGVAVTPSGSGGVQTFTVSATGGGSTNMVTAEIGRLNITNGINITGFEQAAVSLPSYQGDAFALARRTNAPAATGTTNFFEIDQGATAGQALVIHSSASGQIVVTNGTVSGGSLGSTNPVVVYRNNALLDWSNTTAETTNLVYTIPAGQLSTNRSLRFTIAGYCTNATVSRTLRLRAYLGSTTLFDQTSAATGTPATNAWRFEGSLTANNSQSVQSLEGFFSLSSPTTINPGFGLMNNDEQLSITPVIGTGAEDTSTDKALTITLTYNNTGDNFARRVKSQAVLE